MSRIDDRVGHHLDRLFDRRIQVGQIFALNHLVVESISVLVLRADHAVVFSLVKLNCETRLLASVLQITPEDASLGLAESF